MKKEIYKPLGLGITRIPKFYISLFHFFVQKYKLGKRGFRREKQLVSYWVLFLDRTTITVAQRCLKKPLHKDWRVLISNQKHYTVFKISRRVHLSIKAEDNCKLSYALRKQFLLTVDQNNFGNKIPIILKCSET